MTGRAPAGIPAHRRPPNRPQRWQWVVTLMIALGSVASGIASNILANLVDQNGGTVTNVGTVTWIAAGFAIVILGILAVLEVRARRAVEAERAAESARPVPAQLPGVPTDLPYTSGFVGRGDTVAEIVCALEKHHAVALVGRRAVGTSACVVKAANEVRARYPDGQVYLDVRQARRPLKPREVLDALCHKLGVDEAALGKAHDLDTAAALLRGYLAEREVLLVVDNAGQPDQIQPLLPPAARCRLLMAGSTALEGLSGVHTTRLTEPSVDDAAELFAAAAREAGSKLPDLALDPAVREIVELTGRQPHAVRVLGSRMAQQDRSPRDQLTALRTLMAQGRSDHTLALLAARDRAYATLGRDAQRMYRLLALSPQPLSRNAITALCGTNRGHADRIRAELESGGFITETPHGRYQICTHLTEYARIHLYCAEPPRRQIAAQSRLLHYLAQHAERHADALSGPVAATDPATERGNAWFIRHEKLLHTMVCGRWDSQETPPTPPTRRIRRRWLRLAVALCTWYTASGQLDGWAGVCHTVLDSPLARRRAVSGWAHNELGVVYRRQGKPHEAYVELTEAIALRHRRGAAQSRTNLGLTLLDKNDPHGALDQLQRAHGQRSPRDRAGQALTELGLGAAYLALEVPVAARHHLILAANQFDAIGDRRGYAAALTNLTLAQWRLGERLDAAHTASAALDYYEASADKYGRPAALLNAGAMIVAGDPRRATRARKLLENSLQLHRDASRPTGRTLLYLGDTVATLDDMQEARRHWTAAVDACDAANDTKGAAAARKRLSSSSMTGPDRP